MIRLFVLAHVEAGFVASILRLNAIHASGENRD